MLLVPSRLHFGDHGEHRLSGSRGSGILLSSTVSMTISPSTVADDGVLVLGVDRLKDAATLDAAYDDAAGVTAEFNLNMLRRLNRDLHADFDLGRFQHRAFFNAAASRVEMHLVSLEAQAVHVAGERIAFDAGESIWTESSYKYDRETLDALVTSAGFRITRLWTDSADHFWVAYLDAA